MMNIRGWTQIKAAGCSGVGAMPPVATLSRDNNDGISSDLDDEYIATKKEVLKIYNYGGQAP